MTRYGWSQSCGRPTEIDAVHGHPLAREGLSRDTSHAISRQGNGAVPEWWVAFYKPDRVEPAKDLPSGFLSSPRAANEDFARVPYAFPFRTLDRQLDFVLISVHLPAGARESDRQRPTRSRPWRSLTEETFGFGRFMEVIRSS